MKKLLSIVLALCLLLSVLPTTAMASNQSDTVANTIVNYVASNHKTFKSSYGGKAWGCWAFCNYVWKGVFGKDYFANTHTGASSGVETKDIYGFLTKNNAKAGDILWCGTSNFSITHNMIILSYDSEGLYLSDGKADGTLWHNNVRISYNDASYAQYFGGGCRLALYKVNDTYWNAVASSSAPNISSPTPVVPSTPTPNTKPQPPSVTTESGEWDIYIPANYKLLLYGSETAANSITYVSARTSSYRVYCTKKATLSNGIIRYYGGFNASDHYWLTYTNGMTIEDVNATKVHTVNFNANGGNVSTGYKQVTAGGTYGELPTPTRNGYTFDGWYTAASGGTRVTPATSVDLSDFQITLYAHWTSDTSIQYTLETGLWDITIPANYPVTYYAGPGSMTVSGQEPGHSSAYRNVNFKTRAVLANGTIRFSISDDKWFELTSVMSAEDRNNSSIRVEKYVNCYSQVSCSTGVVNLYKNPGDTTRYDYFSNGQSTGSSTYALMSDGSKWYQVHVSSNGTNMDLWLRGDGNVSITTRHTYGAVQYEAVHPHKEYQVCECGQKAYTGTNKKIDSCADCSTVRVTLDLGTIGPKVPAESITVTNGYRYLYVYKPTGEVIKQIGGDVYEVHMTPGSTYQLNTVVSPSNTTDRIQYSVRFPNNDPSNGGGITVSKTGLINANSTAHGSVIIEIICGNCKTEVNIIMCTPTGERL